ncbi:class IIb bacteriocin, lactobin A/cerein 7B family [Streptococcus suis]|uniref:Class IIb bacteriocin, lactobin A/cerein 7B family n=1 Tax=Streptococcus suis TaxID=1307 RepID=A0A426T208_STRSU|nr:class IIb bacteriocin, lactobin A/cerein 7B family [Streptococcus suis]RRR43223.1 class IIb bacteriocin, lactobin A/cerein 7B family [Streptococcus suis]
MTKFETIDNMHTNFVTLSEQELVETDGGIVVTTIVVGGTAIAITGKMIVGGIAGAYGVGYAIGRGLGYF